MQPIAFEPCQEGDDDNECYKYGTDPFDGRRTTLGVANEATTITQYGYDAASRLSSVTNGTNTATYSYIANSHLVSQILFANNAAPRMTTTKQYDLLNRLTNIANVPWADSTVFFAYQYNTANQRTRINEADSSYWLYTYDSLGQVTSGKKY